MGASSSTEMKETKERVDDALNTTRAAIKEGVVIGGGLTLIKITKLLEEHYEPYHLETLCVDTRDALVTALKMPLYQLGINAGVGDPDILVEQLEKSVGDHGYNAKTRKFANLREEGVLDAASVVKSSLRSAISIASMVILTEVLVADL